MTCVILRTCHQNAEREIPKSGTAGVCAWEEEKRQAQETLDGYGGGGLSDDGINRGRGDADGTGQGRMEAIYKGAADAGASFARAISQKVSQVKS